MITDIDTIENGGTRLSRPVAEAQKALRKVWAHRDEFFSEDASPEEVLRGAPEVVPGMLGYELKMPETIPSDHAGFEVAGYMDRVRREIVVAKRQRLEVRRFTVAHEIAHVILHQGEIHHRDRPIDDFDQRAGSSRIEKEANEFAAEFLMPSRLLKTVFFDCFYGPVVTREADDDLSFYISGALGRRVCPQDIADSEPYEIAMIIASMEGFGSNLFDSLRARFAVSSSAMANRLCRLGLVS